MMKIATWNCNGALRKKLVPLITVDADVCVIQECEDPGRSKDRNYIEWASNYSWIGADKNRGLGIFCKNNISFSAVPLDPEGLEYFIPCVIEKRILLLAVWTREANSPTFKYIGQMWKYLQRHKDYFREKQSIIIGDFNSNSCWDKWDRWWNHSDVVRELEELKIVSLYHLKTGEAQGKEEQPTFFMYRKREKPYHIDYVFVHQSLLPGSTLSIETSDIWLQHSDHLPLVTTIMTNNGLQLS